MANSVEDIYTARTTAVTISTPNSNLDGTGSLSSLITGTTNGTFIKTLIIKATTDTGEGMIRIFVRDSGVTNIIAECYVPPIIRSGRDLSFYKTLNIDRTIENGEELLVSTETGDTFNVIAEAFDISFSTTASYLGSTLEFSAKTGSVVTSSANPNLDGSGVTDTVLTAGTGAGQLGCMVQSIIIKAQVTTDPGIVRLFLDLGVDIKVLFAEVLVPSYIQSGNLESFRHEVISGGTLCIGPAIAIMASTEKANAFSLSAVGSDWKNV
jgi:hypothetical protein